MNNLFKTSMHLAASSLVTNYGLGLDCLHKVAGSPPEKADTEPLKQYFSPRELRQVDHFSRLGLLSVCMVLERMHIAMPVGDSFAIVLVSGHGPVERTFSFLNSFLEFGPTMASPLAFSHSVQNIPAATIALKTGLQGLYTTICQFGHGLVQGLLTSHMVLHSNKAEAVLLCLVDEADPFLCTMQADAFPQKASRGDIYEGAACLLLKKGLRETGLNIAGLVVPQPCAETQDTDLADIVVGEHLDKATFPSFKARQNDVVSQLWQGIDLLQTADLLERQAQKKLSALCEHADERLVSRILVTNFLRTETAC